MERDEAEKARSVTVRRDKGDEMIQAHKGLCYQSILKDTEIKFSLSIYLHSLLCSPILQQLLLHISLSSPLSCLSSLMQSVFSFLFSSSAYIQLLLPSTVLCASVTTVLFSCDEAQRTAVLTEPYTCMTNASWGPKQRSGFKSNLEVWIDGEKTQGTCGIVEQEVGEEGEGEVSVSPSVRGRM